MTDRYPCAGCERPMLSQPIYTSDATRWRAQGREVGPWTEVQP